VVGPRRPTMIAVAAFLRSVAISCFPSCEKHANPEFSARRCAARASAAKKFIVGALA